MTQDKTQMDPTEQRLNERTFAYRVLIIAAFVLLLALLFFGSARAEESTSRTFHDRFGRETGRSDTSRDGTTTFRDRFGRETGRSERRGNETIYFDERGRALGTERRNDRQ
jgi:cytochrome oxidase Cu insertion factor (SCO1/SenC/PrrC family)